MKPLLDSNSTKPWVDDIIVEYFEDTPEPDGPVKAHFKLLLPSDSNLTSEDIQELFLPPGYATGSKFDYPRRGVHNLWPYV